MFVFEYKGKPSYYTSDLLEEETVEWLKDVCRSLNVGPLSKFWIPVECDSRTCCDIFTFFNYTAGKKSQIIHRMLRSDHSTNIENVSPMIRRRFTGKDKPFTIPPALSERLTRKEDTLPIMFADYKDFFPFVDRFDFFMEQVRLRLVFMNQHQRSIQCYVWMGAVNAWLLHVDAMCSPRLPWSQQRTFIMLRDFFILVGKTMISEPHKFPKLG